MAVFRVEKTKDFTVMSNHHLKNRKLTLKAKGLLSVMLSLPEEWDYTLKGLACICKEGVDAIRMAVKELENAGYMRDERLLSLCDEVTVLQERYTAECMQKRNEYMVGKTDYVIAVWNGKPVYYVDINDFRMKAI